jgi:hypothetical protein
MACNPDCQRECCNGWVDPVRFHAPENHTTSRMNLFENKLTPIGVTGTIFPEALPVQKRGEERNSAVKS